MSQNAIIHIPRSINEDESLALIKYVEVGRYFKAWIIINEYAYTCIHQTIHKMVYHAEIFSKPKIDHITIEYNNINANKLRVANLTLYCLSAKTLLMNATIQIAIVTHRLRRNQIFSDIISITIAFYE